MKPSIGRIVWYTLSDHDAQSIAMQRMATGGIAGQFNKAAAGQVYPALIVRTWGDTPESAVNLQVVLDGNDVFWATSRSQGDGESHWAWPERVG